MFVLSSKFSRQRGWRENLLHEEGLSRPLGQEFHRPANFRAQFAPNKHAPPIGRFSGPGRHYAPPNHGHVHNEKRLFNFDYSACAGWSAVSAARFTTFIRRSRLLALVLRETLCQRKFLNTKMRCLSALFFAESTNSTNST